MARLFSFISVGTAAKIANTINFIRESRFNENRIHRSNCFRSVNKNIKLNEIHERKERQKERGKADSH